MSFRKHGFSTFDTSDLQFLRVSRKLWPQYLNHRTIFPSNSPTWSSMSGIFIACVCYDKLPQTLWLETPHIHLLSSCGDQKSRMGFSSQQRGIGSAPLALMALGQVLFFFLPFRASGGRGAAAFLGSSSLLHPQSRQRAIFPKPLTLSDSASLIPSSMILTLLPLSHIRTLGIALGPPG